MNIWDAVFGASKIVYKPGGTAYVTHISLLRRRRVGRGRKGKSSSLLTLSPNGLPLRRHVGMCHPKLRGGGGMFFAPFWSENGHRLCAHFGLNSVMVFEGTEGVYERSN